MDMTKRFWKENQLDKLVQFRAYQKEVMFHGSSKSDVKFVDGNEEMHRAVVKTSPGIFTNPAVRNGALETRNQE